MTPPGSSAGQRHHWLPAAFIGRFSAEDTGRMRERPLWVANLGAGKAFRTTPERRALRSGLYDLTDAGHLGGHIDSWHYEPNLPQAVAILVDDGAALRAQDWIDTLVPFVAGLWVRTPERNDGVNNEGRIIEFQEVLAPVAAAHWTVAHFPPNSLITNDRGFTVTTYHAQPAMVVPLDGATALILRAGERAEIVEDGAAHWLAPIEHERGADPARLNAALADAALGDVYGASRELVEAHLPTNTRNPLENGLPFLTVPTDLRAHFFDYFRLRAAVRATGGNESVAAERADFVDLELGPNTLIAMEVSRPERTRGGVFTPGRRIVLDMRWGQTIKALREVAGELINGASMVMTVGQLAGGPEPIALGIEWDTRGVDLARVPMANTETSAITFANLAMLRDDLGADIAGTPPAPH